MFTDSKINSPDFYKTVICSVIIQTLSSVYRNVLLNLLSLLKVYRISIRLIFVK